MPRPSDAIVVTDGFTTGGSGSVDLRRHRGGMNAAFLDGHATWMTMGEFWRVDQDASGVYHLRYVAANR